MNKLLCILLFFQFAIRGATDSLAISKVDTSIVAKIIKSKFTEKDVIVDSDSITEKKFNTNFKSKYRSDDFVYEYKSKEKNAWDRFKEWLGNLLNDIFSFGNKDATADAVGFFMKIIAFGIIIFVIYLIVKAILNKEGQWIFGKNSDKKILNYEEVEKNIKNVDFQKLIKKTIESGEQRLTVRYYYLWILQQLTAKEMIVWDIEKTNSDYIYEIKNLALKEDFSYSSYLYNCIWYGEHELNDTTFAKAKTTFENTLKLISNG